MNAHDVLMYGHRWVHKHLVGLSEEQWLEPNVCGYWSVKDILAHLASFEYVLADVFTGCLQQGNTPALDEYTSMNGDAFNDVQVGMRQGKTPREVLDEYNEFYEKGMQLLARMKPEDLSRPGTLPWYGNEYSIEDFIVYQYYGHKREHCAQIAVYRDRLEARSG